jgi:hypothetical protein
MLADLKKSGLGPEHAKLLRLEPLPEGHKLDIHLDWAGYKIPYFTPEGEVNGFYRFRLLQQQPSSGWGSVTEPPEKPLRYLQPKDSEVNIYLPPLNGSSWRVVMADPEKPVCITEGEKKAACATLLGLMPTIGLGGVYNWQSKRLRQPMLPILEEFEWSKRYVYICYDSDAAQNPMVRLAQSKLCHSLLQRGARIYSVALPGHNSGKHGLDDYIVKHGVETAQALFDKTQPTVSSLAVHEMNDEFALMQDTAEVVTLATGQVISAQKFVDVVCKNRVYMDYVETKDGGQKVTKKFTAREWMEWPYRFTLDKFVYEPGQPTITDVGNYNNWSGWACAPSSKGTVQPWEDLINLLLGNARPEHVVWLKRWLAYPLRFPGAKLYTAVLLWGSAQGTGKTLLGETMRRIYGGNYRAITNLDLASAYNDWVVNHQFIVGDEISTGNKRALTDSLKDIITREQVVVNLKYRPQFTVRDCNNYYFTSNHPDAFFIEDADRRYFIHEVMAQAQAEAFYQRYIKWLDREGGAARLFHHLLEELDMGDFNPKGRAPMTYAKEQMIMDTKSDLGDWVMRLRTDPDSVLRDARMRDAPPLPYKLWTSQDLLRLYDPEGKSKVTANGLTREMKRAGLRYAAGGVNTGLVNGVRTQFWALRGDFARVGPAALARLYKEEREKAEGRKFEKRQIN